MKSSPFAVVGPNGSVKLNLGPGLTGEVWDRIFGAGTADAIAERQTKVLDGQAGWTRQGWFRKCADVRAKAVATLPWGIYPEGSDNDADPLWKDDDVVMPDQFEVLDGLDNAIYLAEASLSLCGAAYFGKRLLGIGERMPGSVLGRFEGLMYWSPKTVTPKIERQGLVYFERLVGSTVLKVAPESVLWIWQPDPFVELGPGSSDGQAAGTGAAALDALARLLSRHMDSGLVKMTVLSLEENTTSTEEQRSTLRQLWARILRKGTDIDGGPPVLQGGKVTPVTIGEGLKGISSKDISTDQREHVATTFGIPWSILQSSAANYATAQVEERGFYLRTVIPQARIIERAFNKRFLKDYGLSFRFEPERHEVMQAWELEKAEKISKATGNKAVLTRNEGRMLLGYEPIDGWDQQDEGPDKVIPAGLITNGNGEAKSFHDERDERIRSDYPALRDQWGYVQAMDELGEREGLSAGQVKRIIYQGTRT